MICILQESGVHYVCIIDLQQSWALALNKFALKEPSVMGSKMRILVTDTTNTMSTNQNFYL